MIRSSIVQRKAAIAQLGEFLNTVAIKKKWGGYKTGVSESEFNDFVNKINTAFHSNGWFTKDMVIQAFKSWAQLMNKANLDIWLNQYEMPVSNYNKTVLIICAGNLPIVGWHDILCSYLCGFKVKVKLSSDDDKLIPAMLSIISLFDNEIGNQIETVEGKSEGFDLVIATGSDNTNRYFESYFGSYPHIFRKSRTSIAVVNENHNSDELSKLADDIFSYYGLGCRSITKIYLPEGYSTDLIFNALFKYKDVVNHNKYMNNYEYYRSIYLMEGISFLDNGFLILKEDENIFSPIGVLHYEFYNNLKKLENHLQSNNENIQCRVGEGGIPFGSAQKPELWDYADGIDTIEFLTKI
ncbi:MAG: acyl-CoA reductase [Crocinitomicaceae bacterium]|nr:acyl-CoA reductase [Crocinitomicaceae bacterium]|tara:strand:- start:12379 stop:13437 length:1059 start_codon:yes stop_codon:yes gene_type:complete